MVNPKYSKIVESLYQNKVNESDESTAIALKRLDKFLKEQKASSNIKMKVNSIINLVRSFCDQIGSNDLIKSSLSHEEGELKDTGSPDSGPSLNVTPSIYEMSFQIRFIDSVANINKLYKELNLKLKKEARKLYKEYDVDDFSISIAVNCSFEDPYGFYVNIERYKKGFLVSVINQTSL